MHGSVLVFFLLITPNLTGSWNTQSSQEERRPRQEMQRVGHIHTKRHMLATEGEQKRRATTPRNREVKKRPGHLTPLHEDEMDNDEIFSVDIGPPPMKSKFERTGWRTNSPRIQNAQQNVQGNAGLQGVTNLVRDVLSQLGREFLTHQVNEDFVFGQYVGNAMRNLTSELRLRMQHEVLELVVKYQRINQGEVFPDERPIHVPHKEEKKYDKKYTVSPNDTDEGWPDFSNLAKISHDSTDQCLLGIGGHGRTTCNSDVEALETKDKSELFLRQKYGANMKNETRAKNKTNKNLKIKIYKIKYAKNLTKTNELSKKNIKTTATNITNTENVSNVTTLRTVTTASLV